MIRPIDRTIELNGELFFEVKDFAEATKRSTQNIRFLMAYGNRFRKLEVKRFGGKPYIPWSELTSYIFTSPGRSSQILYRYDEEGNQVLLQSGQEAPQE